MGGNEELNKLAARGFVDAAVLRHPRLAAISGEWLVKELIREAAGNGRPLSDFDCWALRADPADHPDNVRDLIKDLDRRAVRLARFAITRGKNNRDPVIRVRDDLTLPLLWEYHFEVVRLSRLPLFAGHVLQSALVTDLMNGERVPWRSVGGRPATGLDYEELEAAIAGLYPPGGSPANAAPHAAPVAPARGTRGAITASLPVGIPPTPEELYKAELATGAYYPADGIDIHRMGPAGHLVTFLTARAPFLAPKVTVAANGQWGVAVTCENGATLAAYRSQSAWDHWVRDTLDTTRGAWVERPSTSSIGHRLILSAAEYAVARLIHEAEVDVMGTDEYEALIAELEACMTALLSIAVDAALLDPERRAGLNAELFPVTNLYRKLNGDASLALALERWAGASSG